MYKKTKIYSILFNKIALIRSALIGCVFSPIIICLTSLFFLFNNNSFNFLGYNLDVILESNSASATLSIKPIFAAYLICITLISYVLYMIILTISKTIKV
ncbi:MAG: hypothetical protein LBN03_00930 [Bifidobacteriaceae bacterium]|jgi:hypothetical protein|nr:hypothetical protein [Bifidobacteriaceae bacterium]